MFRIEEHLRTLSDEELRTLFEEFQQLNRNGALPENSKGRSLVDKCLKEYGMAYHASAVMHDIWYEMAIRFYDQP